MGVEVGFEFYRLRNGKFEEAKIIDDYDNSMCNYLYICGRCEATSIFINLIEKYEGKDSHSKDATDEDKYYAYALLNHPELDGFEDHTKEYEWSNHYKKYFFLDLNQFKSNFNFEEAQIKHDRLLKELNDELNDLQKEKENLRTHQENAKTKAAFDGFEEKIIELKEDIASKKDCIKDVEEDDYNYNHFMWIKEYIEQVDVIIKNDPTIIAVAFYSY